MKFDELLKNGGVRYNMPENVYHSIPALSQSGLKAFAKSPAHYKAYIDEAFKQTPAMLAGKIVHLMALEPKEVESRLAIIDGNRNSTEVKTKIAEAERNNKLVCKSEQLEIYTRAIEAFKNDPAVKLALDGANHEVSVFWMNEYDIPCKARFDILNLKKGILADIKWTSIELTESLDSSDLDPMRFRKATAIEDHMYRMQYHWQQAWYLEAIDKVFKRDFEHAGFIFIESDTPHTIASLIPSFGFVELARQEMQPYLEDFAKCWKTNEWPRKGGKFFDVAPPYWAFNKE